MLCKHFIAACVAVLPGLIAIPAQADILLNEVHLNPPGEDGNYEFIELKSTTGGVESCAGLSIVIIDNDATTDVSDVNPAGIGIVTSVWKLDGLSTGANGLLLLGSRYATSPRGGPWAATVPPDTAVGSPPGMSEKEIGSNDGLTILLAADATLEEGLDLDVDNNGILDWGQAPPPNIQVPALPWSALRDSVGTGLQSQPRPYVVTAANINSLWISSALGNRSADTMARRLNRVAAHSAVEWYGGKLDGSPSSRAYRTTRFFGPGSMFGTVTPGRPNLDSGLPPTSFRINEVGLNPTGLNARFQYVEIINTHGQARSLRGFDLLVVDSHNVTPFPAGDPFPGGGRIIERWSLSDMATGENVGSSRVDLQACKLEYSIVSPK